MAGLDGLVSDAARLGHAMQPGHRVAGAAGDLRGFGERSLSAGLHDPEIDLRRFHDVQRIGYQTVVDTDHRRHDGHQQAEAKTGQHEAKEVVAHVPVGKVHGASPVMRAIRLSDSPLTGAATAFVPSGRPETISTFASSVRWPKITSVSASRPSCTTQTRP